MKLFGPGVQVAIDHEAEKGQEVFHGTLRRFRMPSRI